jgi:hypothetical protein
MLRFKRLAIGGFSSKCSRLLAFPCAKYHLFFDHFVHRTVFQISGDDTTLVLRVISSNIAIFYSSWAFPLAISQICLTSFPSMRCAARAAFSAITSRFSSPFAPGLMLSSLSWSGLSSSSMDQSQPIYIRLVSCLPCSAPQLRARLRAKPACVTEFVNVVNLQNPAFLSLCIFRR